LTLTSQIELLRGRNVHVAEQSASRNRNAIFLSTVTVAELMFGALRSRKSQESTVICRQFCSAFQLVELDQDAGERFRRHQGGPGRARVIG
jgi:predicted nucleic acid-binding protein